MRELIIQRIKNLGECDPAWPANGASPIFSQAKPGYEAWLRLLSDEALLDAYARVLANLD